MSIEIFWVFTINNRENAITIFLKRKYRKKEKNGIVYISQKGKAYGSNIGDQRQASFCLLQQLHFLTAFFLAYNISMSFPNFQYPLYPNWYTITTSLFPFSYQAYLIPSLSAPQITPKEEAHSEERQNYCFSDSQKLAAVEQGLDSHRKTHWTSEQDKLLEKLVEVQKLQWKEMSRHFPERTQNMCYSRYRRIAMSTRDKAWTKADQELVATYVQRVGQKWKLISNSLPKFTPKQIRERYLNYLRPNINKEDFSLEEDLVIARYVLQEGRHWRKMEQLLPGRAQGAIKGRFYGKLQKIILNTLGNTHFT